MMRSSDMPHADDQQSKLDLGALSKLAAGCAALAYATGTLAISAYLHQLGVTDFSFAKPKLILTGVLVLFTFLLLTPMPVFVAWRMTGEGRTLHLSGRTLFWLLLPLFLLISASACLCFRERTGLGQIAVWKVWAMISADMKERNVLTESLATLTIAVEVYLPVWIAVGSAFWAKRLFSRAKLQASTSEILAQKVYFSFATGLAIVFIIGYVYAFAFTFYPAISPAIGGGKPYFESFAIVEEERCQLQQLGIPFNTERPNVTKFLPVLHESDALVAVWLERNNGTDGIENWSSVVVQLGKEQIGATVADPRERHIQQLAPPLTSCKPASKNP
jgi:hypothetical protein